MPVPSRTYVDPNYELPKLVDRFVEGWLGTLGGGSLASTVLAAVSASIFVHIQEQMKFPQSPGVVLLTSAVSTPRGNALLVFAYLGIIINCNAAITSFFILDKLAETPFTSAKRQHLVKNTALYANDNSSERKVYSADGVNALFVEHSEWKSWRYYKVYWVVAQFLGVICIFIELMLYLWIVESSLGVQVPVTVAVILSLLPLFAFFGTGFAKMIKMACVE